MPVVCNVLTYSQNANVSTQLYPLRSLHHSNQSKLSTVTLKEIIPFVHYFAPSANQLHL